MMIRAIHDRDPRAGIAELLAKGQPTKPCAKHHYVNRFVASHAFNLG
jgi:hypothetical protein